MHAVCEGSVGVTRLLLGATITISNLLVLLLVVVVLILIMIITAMIIMIMIIQQARPTTVDTPGATGATPLLRAVQKRHSGGS